MYTRLLIGLHGPRLSAVEKRRLRAFPPRGVILFARNIETPSQVRRLLAEARDCSGTPLWAAVDEEGGAVTRIPWPPFSSRTPASRFGREYAFRGEEARRAVYEDALIVGGALRDLGFTHNCAPVLDLALPGGHTVVGDRAYGSDPEVVAALGAACVRGLHDAGIEAVGKHFPGHGRADSDSHVSVPVVKAPQELLLSEAMPFRRLIRDGLRHVMVTHVLFADVDTSVATQSSFWLQDVLRRRMHFRGAIWSDDLCMRGAGTDVLQAALRAYRAGCDVLLVCDPQGVDRIYHGGMDSRVCG